MHDHDEGGPSELGASSHAHRRRSFADAPCLHARHIASAGAKRSIRSVVVPFVVSRGPAALLPRGQSDRRLGTFPQFEARKRGRRRRASCEWVACRPRAGGIGRVAACDSPQTGSIRPPVRSSSRQDPLPLRMRRTAPGRDCSAMLLRVLDRRGGRRVSSQTLVPAGYIKAAIMRWPGSRTDGGWGRGG
jgi:hypothetical protein